MSRIHYSEIRCRRLDEAVDVGDADRVAFLFEQYDKLTGLLTQDKPKRRTRAG